MLHKLCVLAVLAFIGCAYGSSAIDSGTSALGVRDNYLNVYLRIRDKDIVQLMPALECWGEIAAEGARGESAFLKLRVSLDGSTEYALPDILNLVSKAVGLKAAYLYIDSDFPREGIIVGREKQEASLFKGRILYLKYSTTRIGREAPVVLETR